MSLHVVGARFANPKGKGNREFEILVCEPGEAIELRPEPKNEADPHAIAVYSARGIQIGYLTAERAPWIGDFIRSKVGVVAIFQEPTQFGAAIRVAIGGGLPTLPSKAAAPESPDYADGADRDDTAGFYPDWIPPDD